MPRRAGTRTGRQDAAWIALAAFVLWGIAGKSAHARGVSESSEHTVRASREAKPLPQPHPSPSTNRSRLLRLAVAVGAPLMAVAAATSLVTSAPFLLTLPAAMAATGGYVGYRAWEDRRKASPAAPHADSDNPAAALRDLGKDLGPPAQKDDEQPPPAETTPASGEAPKGSSSALNSDLKPAVDPLDEAAKDSGKSASDKR